MGFPFPATTNHIRSVISLLTVIIVGSILVGCAGASSLSSPPASPSAAGPTRRPLSATALLIALTPTSTMEVSNSDVVTLTGLVDQPGPITVAALQQFPSQTQTISYQVGRNWQTHTVEGVPLYTVLSRAGITELYGHQSDALHSAFDGALQCAGKAGGTVRAGRAAIHLSVQPRGVGRRDAGGRHGKGRHRTHFSISIVRVSMVRVTCMTFMLAL